MTRDLNTWMRHLASISAPMALLLGCVVMCGCDVPSAPEPVQARAAATAAAPESSRPGQGEFDFAADPTLDVEPLEERVIALLAGFEGALAQSLPDARASLDAATAYVERSMAEAEQVGNQLRQIKATATEEQRDEWVARVNDRYAEAVGEWRRTLARFEKHASDAEIVELNALVKRLAAPMKLPR